MAINRFRQSGTSDMSAFCSWLNEHKEGTFLEECTISTSQTSSANDTLTISDGTVQIKAVSNYHSSISDVFKYNFSTFSFSAKAPSYSDTYVYVTGAILCNKGLIIQFNGKVSSTYTGDCYGICVTADSNGKLAAIAATGTIPSESTQIGSWYTVAYGSTTSMQRSSRPYFGSSMTSLAQISAQGTDSTLVLPYAYSAIATQLSAEGLNSVLIDGAPYITNGVWYIKDAE